MSNVEGYPLSTLIASVLGGFLFLNLYPFFQVLWLALIVWLFVAEQRDQDALIERNSRTGRR